MATIANGRQYVWAQTNGTDNSVPHGFSRPDINTPQPFYTWLDIGPAPVTSTPGADVLQNQTPPIAPTNVISNPGQGVTAPNAGQPLSVTNNADGSIGRVRGTVAGVTFNIG